MSPYLKCKHCNKPIEGVAPSLPFMPSALSYINNNESNVVIYANDPYHKECILKNAGVIIKNARVASVSVSFEYKIPELISIIDDLQRVIDICERDKVDIKLSSPTRRVLTKFASVICEHNSDYITCANKECNKLILRKNAIVGERTRAFQDMHKELTGLLFKKKASADVNIDPKLPEKQNGIVYKVIHFCSPKCDGYFSSKLGNLIQTRLTDAQKKVDAITDKTNKLIDVYESTIQTPENKKKFRMILEAQCRVKVKSEMDATQKDVEKMTKEWIG